MSEPILRPHLRGVAALLTGAAAWCAPAIAAATPPLDLPWECGQVQIVTQGHNNPPSHTGKGAWAWDFNIAEGQDVLAVADGVIRRVKGDSARYGCSDAYANDGNYVILDFEDGTEALYLHLQKGSLFVEAGDRVERGQRLGKVGKSGWICGQVNEGVHLHFHIQRTCASWYCQSFQTNFDMTGPLSYGDSIESMNCPREVSCALGAEGGVIDDQDPCFRRATQWWWTEPSGGWQDSWQYTYAIDAPQADTQAWWRFEIEQADDYVVEAHIPPGAQSQQARYYIHLDGQELGPFQIDQTSQTGWVELATLAMPAGAAGDVNLRDNTGEPYSEEGKRRIAFDAVRLRPAQDVVTMPEDMGAPVDPGAPDMGPGPAPEPSPMVDMGAPSEPGGSLDLGADTPGPDPGEGQPPSEPAEGRMGAPGGSVNAEGSACASASGPARPARGAPWALLGLPFGWMIVTRGPGRARRRRG